MEGDEKQPIAEVLPAPNPSSATSVFAKSSDVWLLQHLHYLALRDDLERAAQTTLLNTFWSRLANHDQLDTAFSQVRAANAQLAASCAEKERLIADLRIQLAQNTTERDLTQTISRLSHVFASIADNMNDDLSSCLDNMRKTYMEIQIDYDQRGRQNIFLSKELQQARQEAKLAIEQFQSLRFHMDAAIALKDEEIAELSETVRDLQEGKGQGESEETARRPKRRRKQ